MLATLSRTGKLADRDALVPRQNFQFTIPLPDILSSIHEALYAGGQAAVYLCMKYSQQIGIAAALILALSGLLNWTWYPDLHQYFTGFSTYNNMYGKPAMVFIFLAAIAIIFFVVPRVWAKRWNLFIGAIVVAYAIKTFILYSGCYRGICPQKQPGIWVMLLSAALMMIATLLPDLALRKKDDD